MTYPTRFILMCHGRVGSTLLGSLLASHPAIAWGDEKFSTYLDWRGIKAVARRVVVRYPLLRLDWLALCGRRPVFGCKMAPYYVRNIGQTVTQLHKRGWLIIYLRRRNTFCEAVSRIVTLETKRYHYADDRVTQAQTGPWLTIDPGAFVDMLFSRTALALHEVQILTDLPHLAVCYEDDLVDPASWAATAGRIFTALGLPPAPLHTDVRRTWDRPYAEIIVNYAELVEAARAAGYSHFLE